mgnify:CR=1 FL=1
MKRISEKVMRARILVLAVVLITVFSAVSCGADTQGIRISDGVWSGTVIPDAADTVPVENVQSENVIVTEPPDDTGAVTDTVISPDESEPVTMTDAHPDESAPETAPADTTANDTTDRSEPLPETTAVPETVRAPETTKAPETKVQETTKAPETTSATATDSQSSSSDRKTGTVYWVESGKVWHTTDKCSTLSRSKDIMSGTVDAAKAAGKERVCKRCGG